MADFFDEGPDFFNPVVADTTNTENVDPTGAGFAAFQNAAAGFGFDVSNFKPDGTPASLLPAATSVKQGDAKVTTGEITDSATNPLEDGEGTVKTDSEDTTDSNLESHLKNILLNPMENFASYAPLWTLAVLTREQFNNPEIYRTTDLSFAGHFDWNDDISDNTLYESSIVFSSGGRGDEYRTNTAHGAPEYFIENFRMRTVVSPNSKSGNTNAINFEFDVLEPYSMGLFLQSMQNAALKAGHRNYLTAPFLLRLDIKGWDENGKILESIKPKYFVLKINKATFNVNEGGSRYNVTGVPYNHLGFSDSVNTLFNDITIYAETKGTVDELLVSGEHSLCRFLNDNEERLVKAKKIGVPDVYEVQFANSSDDFTSSQETEQPDTATQTPGQGTPGQQTIKGASSGGETALEFGSNAISNANFGFDASAGGNYIFVKEGDVYDPDTGTVQRDKVTIDTKNRAFMFGQGQSLTDIITQVVLSSSFAKDAIDSNKLDKSGMVTWFRIDVQIELLDYDSVVGDFARKIIYRVVPYKVHHSIFSNPTSAPVGLPEMTKEAAKHYQYIYTGQNSDIIKFDIEINNLFYVGINSSSESNSASVVNPDQNGAAVNDVRAVTTGEGVAGDEAQITNTGRTRPKRDPNLLAKKVGGSGTKDVEQIVAESFHNAFINGSSADLVRVKITVLGDPYWLVDSGMANYFSPASAQSRLITEDGTMNFESGEVYIYISFRTPADVNETTGLYDFSKLVKESPFSGLYRVTACENMFDNGSWLQELNCVRLQRQPNDYNGKTLTTQTNGVFASEVGDVLPVKASPLDEYTDIIAQRYNISADSEQARLLAEQEAEFFEDEEQEETTAAETAATTPPPPLYTGTVSGPEDGEAETVFNEYSMEEEETGRVWDDNLGDYI